MSRPPASFTDIPDAPTPKVPPPPATTASSLLAATSLLQRASVPPGGGGGGSGTAAAHLATVAASDPHAILDAIVDDNVLLPKRYQGNLWLWRRDDAHDRAAPLRQPTAHAPATTVNVATAAATAAAAATSTTGAGGSRERSSSPAAVPTTRGDDFDDIGLPTPPSGYALQPEEVAAREDSAPFRCPDHRAAVAVCEEAVYIFMAAAVPISTLRDVEHRVKERAQQQKQQKKSSDNGSSASHTTSDEWVHKARVILGFRISASGQVTVVERDVPTSAGPVTAPVLFESFTHARAWRPFSYFALYPTILGAVMLDKLYVLVPNEVELAVALPCEPGTRAYAVNGHDRRCVAGCPGPSSARTQQSPVYRVLNSSWIGIPTRSPDSPVPTPEVPKNERGRLHLFHNHSTARYVAMANGLRPTNLLAAAREVLARAQQAPATNHSGSDDMDDFDAFVDVRFGAAAETTTTSATTSHTAPKHTATSGPPTSFFDDDHPRAPPGPGPSPPAALHGGASTLRARPVFHISFSPAEVVANGTFYFCDSVDVAGASPFPFCGTAQAAAESGDPSSPLTSSYSPGKGSNGPTKTLFEADWNPTMRRPFRQALLDTLGRAFAAEAANATKRVQHHLQQETLIAWDALLSLSVGGSATTSSSVTSNSGAVVSLKELSTLLASSMLCSRLVRGFVGSEVVNVNAGAVGTFSKLFAEPSSSTTNTTTGATNPQFPPPTSSSQQQQQRALTELESVPCETMTVCLMGRQNCLNPGPRYFGRGLNEAVHGVGNDHIVELLAWQRVDLYATTKGTAGLAATPATTNAAVTTSTPTTTSKTTGAAYADPFDDFFNKGATQQQPQQPVPATTGAAAVSLASASPTPLRTYAGHYYRFARHVMLRGTIPVRWKTILPNPFGTPFGLISAAFVTKMEFDTTPSTISSSTNNKGSSGSASVPAHYTKVNEGTPEYFMAMRDKLGGRGDGPDRHVKESFMAFDERNAIRTLQNTNHGDMVVPHCARPQAHLRCVNLLRQGHEEDELTHHYVHAVRRANDTIGPTAGGSMSPSGSAAAVELVHVDWLNLCKSVGTESAVAVLWGNTVPFLLEADRQAPVGPAAEGSNTSNGTLTTADIGPRTAVATTGYLFTSGLAPGVVEAMLAHERSATAASPTHALIPVTLADGGWCASTAATHGPMRGSFEASPSRPAMATVQDHFLRINCADSLDRTNLCSYFVAQQVMLDMCAHVFRLGVAGESAQDPSGGIAMRVSGLFRQADPPATAAFHMDDSDTSDDDEAGVKARKASGLEGDGGAMRKKTSAGKLATGMWKYFSGNGTAVAHPPPPTVGAAPPAGSFFDDMPAEHFPARRGGGALVRTASSTSTDGHRGPATRGSLSAPRDDVCLSDAAIAACTAETDQQLIDDFFGGGGSAKTAPVTKAGSIREREASSGRGDGPPVPLQPTSPPPAPVTVAVVPTVRRKFRHPFADTYAELIEDGLRAQRRSIATRLAQQHQHQQAILAYADGVDTAPVTMSPATAAALPDAGTAPPALVGPTTCVCPYALLRALATIFIANGDAISMSYTNSQALHTNILRGFVGAKAASSNAVLSAKRRYENVFEDKKKMRLIDALLGRNLELHFPSLCTGPFALCRLPISRWRTALVLHNVPLWATEADIDAAIRAAWDDHVRRRNPKTIAHRGHELAMRAVLGSTSGHHHHFHASSARFALQAYVTALLQGTGLTVPSMRPVHTALAVLLSAAGTRCDFGIERRVALEAAQQWLGVCATSTSPSASAATAASNALPDDFVLVDGTGPMPDDDDDMDRTQALALLETSSSVHFSAPNTPAVLPPSTASGKGGGALALPLRSSASFGSVASDGTPDDDLLDATTTAAVLTLVDAAKHIAVVVFRPPASGNGSGNAHHPTAAVSVVSKDEIEVVQASAAPAHHQGTHDDTTNFVNPLLALGAIEVRKLPPANNGGANTTAAGAERRAICTLRAFDYTYEGAGRFTAATTHEAYHARVPVAVSDPCPYPAGATVRYHPRGGAAASGVTEQLPIDAPPSEQPQVFDPSDLQAAQFADGGDGSGHGGGATSPRGGSMGGGGYYGSQHGAAGGRALSSATAAASKAVSSLKHGFRSLVRKM